MRALTDAGRIRQLMEALARASETTGGLIERGELLRLFAAIEPDLYRYPVLDPPSFRVAVEEFAAS